MNQDTVQMWLTLAGKRPLLSASEELELGKQVREHEDQDAKNKLVEYNLRLVISVASRFQNRGQEFSDLIQDGNIGLIRAAEKYDYNKGYKFSTYATFWIKQAITRGLSDTGRTIRLPAHITEKLYKLNRLTGELVQELGREPTEEELMEKTGYSEETIRLLLDNVREPISMDSTVVGDEDDGTLFDLIEDESVPTTNEIIHRIMIHKEVHTKLLAVLTPRERDVMKLRFGLFGTRSYTLEQTGGILGVTRERARQIEWKALTKVRNAFRWAEILKTISA
jgi:RNA polymerase primary sigma factor